MKILCTIILVNPGELANEINGVKYYNPMMIFPAIIVAATLPRVS